MSPVTAQSTVVEIDLDDGTPPGPVACPRRFGTVTRYQRHLVVDRSGVSLGDVYVTSAGSRVRLSTDPAALSAGQPIPTDLLLGRTLAATLGIRNDAPRTPNSDVCRVPALSRAEVSAEMVRSRCAREALPEERRPRRRELTGMAADLRNLVRQPAGITAVACSGGVSSEWLWHARTGLGDPEPITAVACGRTGSGSAVLAGRFAPMIGAVELATDRGLDVLLTGAGLRPLLMLAGPTDRGVGAGSASVGVEAPAPMVPWLTRDGEVLLHEMTDASRHGWETWLGDVDADRARLAWCWTDPGFTAVLRRADAVGVAHRSPVESADFVRLAFQLGRHGSRGDPAGFATASAVAARRISGEQLLHRRAVDWADAYAGSTAPPRVLADAGLVDPLAFTRTIEHPFLRAQHALALRRTVEAERWLSDLIEPRSPTGGRSPSASGSPTSAAGGAWSSISTG